MEENKNESFEELLAQQGPAAASEKLYAGQKIRGKVIAVSGDSVFIDIGMKQDGVMDRSEILNDAGEETVAPGDEIEAWVVHLSSQGARLSKGMIGGGAEALEDAKDNGIPVEGKIIGPCKGGYQVEVLGKKAFCPGSQLDMPAGAAPDSLVGQNFQFLITRVENNGRNVVVSRRALIERERKENLDKLLSELNIGDIIEGQISRFAAFGAFVELMPSVEGLVHISELSWSRVGSPDEAVSIGDKVRAKVVGIAKDEKGQSRISLSIRKAQDDPWLNVGEKFSLGDIVEGKVSRLAPFGAFIEIAPGIEGLAHISELSWEKRISNPEEMLAAGDRIQVKIKELHPDSRRISLSVRDAQGDPWQDVEEKFPVGLAVKGTIAEKSPHGLFVTLAPGITGLLPKGAINKAAGDIAKAGAGDSIDVQIRSIDPSSRRISLIPASTEAKEPEDTSWKKHVGAPDKTGGRDFGIMAQALRKAFDKK